MAARCPGPPRRKITNYGWSTSRDSNENQARSGTPDADLIAPTRDSRRNGIASTRKPSAGGSLIAPSGIASAPGHWCAVAFPNGEGSGAHRCDGRASTVAVEDADWYAVNGSATPASHSATRARPTGWRHRHAAGAWPPQPYA